jgi:hypothetical protein
MYTTEATRPTDTLPPQRTKRAIYAVRTGVRAGAPTIGRVPPKHPNPGG